MHVHLHASLFHAASFGEKGISASIADFTTGAVAIVPSQGRRTSSALGYVSLNRGAGFPAVCRHPTAG